MPDKKNKTKSRITAARARTTAQSTEKTVIKSLALGGLLGGGAPCAIDVKDSKVIRIRPLHYDWKYDTRKFNPFRFTRNGKTLEPTNKSLPAPFSRH